MTTEGIVYYGAANTGTPPTSKPQTQNQNLCLSGLCTPSAPTPTQLIRTGASGPGGVGVIATGGIGVYVKPAGTAVSPDQLAPHTGDLPRYRPGGR